MPITRYQIRNEYSLADPELYRAADRDDPEALLEGVAMAGLVGVLRQLGDLAEFAAEIFRDLHEEVMATAARGHGMMLRVHQLEAEFPSIEKAFLSQTSHSHFAYNAGIDWHANLRMDQNLITRGDLPRFIMDSYEECRGPPRLFLLDKFDVAGAGACLKRFSDPSFFKTELASLQMMKAEVQREKKVRKIKKKGARWRNGETQDILSAFHISSILHPVVSEEHNKVPKDTPTRRVKLRTRNLNGSSFHSSTGRSYMERVLEVLSPEIKVVCENSTSPSNLKTESCDNGEPILEIREIRTDGLARKSSERDIVLISSPKNRKIPDSSVDDIGEDIINGVISESLPKPLAEILVEKIPSTFHQGDQKELPFDGERKTEASADGYRSDDVASELDNYTDALTTMESEIETDTETRAKHEMGFFNIGSQGMNSDTNELRELHGQCSDSHSVGNSSASGDLNSSFKKGRSSLSNSDTLSSFTDMKPSLENGITTNMLTNSENSSKLEDTISAESAPSFSVGDRAAEVFVSTQNFPAEIHDTSENLSRNGEVLETKYSDYLVSNGVCSTESEIPNHRSEFGEPSSSPRENSSEIESAQPDLIEIPPVSLQSHTLATSSNTEEVGKHIREGSPPQMDITDLPSQITSDIFPTGFSESCPAEMLAGTVSDVSSDALLNSSDTEDLPTGTNGYILENFHSTEYFEDRSAEVSTGITQDCNSDDLRSTLPSITKDEGILKEAVSGCTESSPASEKHLIIAPTEEQLHDFIEKDAETSSSISTSSPRECLTDFPPHTNLVNAEPDGLVVERGNVVPSIENLEYVGSDLDLRKSGLAEQELQTATAGVHQLESENYFDAEPPDLSTANPEEFCSTSSGAELFFINNEVQPSAFDCGMKDGSTPDRNCLNSVLLMENGSTTLPIDIHAQTDGLLTGSVLKGADSGGLDPDVTGSLEASGEHIKFQKECVLGESVSDQQEVEISEAAYPDDRIVSDSQSIPVAPLSAKESTLPVVDFADLTSAPCNLDFSHSSCSESFDHIHDLAHTELTETQFPPCNGAGVSISPREDVQEPEPESLHQSSQQNTEVAMFPSNHFLPDTATFFDQSFGLHKDGEKSDSSHLRIERMQLTEQIDPPHEYEDGSLMDPYEASPAGISQPSEPEFHSELHVIPSNDMINMLNASSSTTSTCSTSKPEASITFPPGHNFESSELPISSLDSNTSDTLPPIFPSFELLVSERDYQLSSESLLDRPGLGSPFLETLQANEEDIPPLPPLPPIQWRIGKLRFGSPTLGATMQPQNTVAPLPTMEDVNPFLDFISLEGGMTQPPNPFTLLPTIEDEKPQYVSMTSEGEEQPMDSLKSSPTIGVEKPQQHDALDFKGEIVQPTNPFTSRSTIEDEIPQCGLLTLEGEVAVHPYSSAPAPAVGDEKLQHDVILLDEETAPSLNPFLLLPTIEYENPDANSQSERPRDPLIEAVAAHDKRTLRKASERVRPSMKPVADERDNLLEQIRNKSFNLKPAVVTKPSIQGPKTNLNVAAILEKANAIRQALAGSDEDDGDTWSDC